MHRTPPLISKREKQKPILRNQIYHKIHRTTLLKKTLVVEQEPWFWTQKQADQHGLHPMEHTIIFVPCGPCVQVHEGTVIIELSNNQHLVKIHYIGCAWLACVHSHKLVTIC